MQPCGTVSRVRRPIRPVDPGTLLATTHPLAGGGRVRLRLARPSDLGRVRSFLEGLSPDTLRRRFFTATPRIGAELVRHFAFFNPRERMVVAATMPVDGRERIVGLADVALLATGLAELAVVVDDAEQSKGIGGLLAEAIASLAAQRGATHLKVEMLEPNPALLAIMRSLGPAVQAVESGHPVAYVRIAAAGTRAA